MAESDESYYVSLETTEEYSNFWKSSHNQTRLGLAAFTGLGEIAKERREGWEDGEIDALSRYIEDSIFQRAIDNFQTYIVEIIALIFSTKPEMVPKGAIESKIIFQVNDIDELRSLVVENAATKFAYMNVVDLDDDLKKRYDFSLFSSRLQKLRIKRLVEIRNIIVHNRSLKNRMFIEKCGAKFDRVGDLVTFPHPICVDHYLDSVAEQIDRAAIDKFKLPRVNHGF